MAGGPQSCARPVRQAVRQRPGWIALPGKPASCYTGPTHPAIKAASSARHTYNKMHPTDLHHVPVALLREVVTSSAANQFIGYPKITQMLTYLDVTLYMHTCRNLCRGRTNARAASPKCSCYKISSVRTTMNQLDGCTHQPSSLALPSAMMLGSTQRSQSTMVPGCFAA